MYLAAFRQGLTSTPRCPTSPSACRTARDGGVKWIANYDNQFKGPIPVRQALAESRNAVAVWIAARSASTR